MPRPSDFDLAAALRTPSFTPAQRDVPALVELVVAGDEHAPGALAGLGEVARRALAERADDDEAARARVVAALGLIARRGDAAAVALVIAGLGDASSRVRRAAIGALGKLAGAPLESTDSGAAEPGREALAALLARWDAGDVTPDERRVLVDALGKRGGDAALARVRALDPGGDAELARRRDRALLVAERSAARGDDSSVRDDVAPPTPVAVALRCKPGLAGLLVEELRGHGLAAREAVDGRDLRPAGSTADGGCGVIDGRDLRPAGSTADGGCGVIDDATVALELAAPWRALWASRLWLTAGVRVPRAPGDAVESITRALLAARPLLAAWTRGPIRWRLELPTKQRAVIWRVAKAVAAAAPELVNDPTATTWDVVALDDALELRPRRIADPRFVYRVAEVPAASHPTVAAALAFVAGARPGDRVWDPFVGSGLELVERARLGPVRSLAGTDLAEAALAAARANLAAAGVVAELARGDARAAPGSADLDLVITNPPLGGRVQVDAAALLGELVPVVARRLAPGGRLVWITPAARRTGELAARHGLVRSRVLPIDLGGVRGQLERWDR